MNPRPELVDRCPHCNRPVEEGYVYGDRGLFWDPKVRALGFPAEMLTRSRWSGLEAMSAIRCRSCQLVLFRHSVSKTWHGLLGGYY